MVKNQVHSSQSGTFDISAAMLHIIKNGSFQEMVKMAEGGFLSHRLFTCAQLFQTSGSHKTAYNTK